MKILLLLGLVGSISCAFRDHANKIYIGAAVSPTYFSDATYQSLAGAQFNFLTPENEMKIDATEPSQGQFNYAQADELVQFAQTNNMKVRGHTLVWHSQVPSWMQSLTGTALEEAMKNHISNVMGRYKGGIYAWDVVNEVFNEDGTLRDSIWTQAMQSGFIATAFQAAREADPNAKLYINDYNIEGVNAKSTGLYNLVQELKTQGVPIDGVGFQAHFTAGSVPTDLQTNLQRFADLGVDVAITELDIGGAGQEAQQATDYATVIQDCLAVSRCVGVTIWGIMDKYSWRASTNPLPFDDNGNAKAAATAIEGALQ
ncbi:hypothetical protein NQ318_003462 [Aromia moschata]|uniref:endo-1,4-beta-xylanase n=1 Tax=Aromia moschata TaxID=1265417 RepID=A0AAV8YX90_9CUCU|nr:hypothetical protein NQ318_003462 [Aromia moschata]